MKHLARMKVAAMAAVCAMAVALKSQGEVTFQGKTVRSLSVYPFE